MPGNVSEDEGFLPVCIGLQQEGTVLTSPATITISTKNLTATGVCVYVGIIRQAVNRLGKYVGAWGKA